MASSAEASQTYYRPYLPSDSEASDTETGSEYSPPQSPRPDNAGEDLGMAGQDFAALALALKGPSTRQATGPDFATIEQNDTYAFNRIGKNVYGSYPSAVSSGEPIKMNSTDVPTVVMLQSLDRDKRTFIQPTDCRLMLPRVYTNVSGFSIAQMNLTSAFFYFNQTKNNVSIQLYEDERVVYPPVLQPSPVLVGGNALPLKPINNIRNGSYNINSLMAELTIQLNQTPLFYDFVNGFSDFLQVFPISGDYSLNFNEPGDTYFDSLTKSFVPNPTRESITGYYFQARYFLNTSPTIQQILIAYYYPVLKEVILDSDTTISGTTATWNNLTFNLSYTDSKVDIKTYIIHYFKGVDDLVIQSIINNNNITAPLDTYRLYHTFRYSLVNKYICSVDSANNRVSIQTTGLNTSLSNLLVNKYNSILNQQIAANSLTNPEYANLANTVVTNRAIFQDMYGLLQKMFATYFAVNFGTYAAEYYVNSNNSLILRYGLDAANVSLTYNPSVSPVPRTVDIMKSFQEIPPAYWPYMVNLSNTIGAPINMGSTIDPYPVSSNFPYNLSISNIDPQRNFIDSNGYIYTDYRRKAGDILINVEASKYTIFKFKSQYRQSIQIETLPRQTQFRYPAWNAVNPVNYPIRQLFDASYCYVAPDPNTDEGKSMLTRDISFNAVYGWSNDIFQDPSPNFGTGFNTSLEYWGDRFEEQINIANSNGRVYTVRAPYVNNTKDSNIYKYEFNISFYSPAKFPIDYYGFLYHDIAALAADVSAVGKLKENPYHYKQRVVFASNTLSNNITFQAYAGQTYYALFRPSVISPPATFYKVVPWMPGSTYTTLSQEPPDPTIDPATQLSKYAAAIQADPDFIRLPIISTLWSSNSPTNMISTMGAQALSTLATSIGYDISGVSLDLTDYIPFVPYNQVSTINPVARYRVDPINNFVFQFNTPYDKRYKSYFPPGNNNAIFSYAAVGQYTPKAVLAKQYKMVQYYNTAYINDTGNVSYLKSSINSNLPPYTLATTGGVGLSGYTYTSGDTDETTFLEFGQGICGYTFLPGDGNWAIDRLTFKTNFVNPADPGNLNSKIHLLAVFYTSEIYSFPVSYANLSNALGIFLRVSEQTYNQRNTNLGFDSGYGTYYTFSNYPALLQRKNAIISGFTQSPGQLITDLSSYYSVVPYTLQDFISSDGSSTWDYRNINVSLSNLSNASLAQIQNITGSLIPYPYGCAISTSAVFYDGIPAPSGADMIIASAPFSTPTPGYTSNIYAPDSNLGSPAQSVCQYEQSVPYVNSHMLFKQPQDIITDSNGFSSWSKLPVIPDYIHASVFGTTTYGDSNSTWVNGYMLFQRDAFALVNYRMFRSVDPYTKPERNFTFMGHIAIQQIYPDMEKTSLIAVSGNDSNFAFLGVRHSDQQLRVKVFDPISGVMIELPKNPQYTFNPNYLLQKFVFNNSNGWFYSAHVANTTTIVFTGTPSYADSNDTHYISRTFTGRFSELQMPPNGKNVYFAPFMANGFSTMFMYPLDYTDPNSPFNTVPIGNGIQVTLDTAPVSTFPYYTQMLAVLNIKTEEVLFLNKDYDSRKYFKLRAFVSAGSLVASNTKIVPSAQNFTDASGNFIQIERIMPGAMGSKWAMSESPPYILGNRNDAHDSPISFGLAWQVFFPTIKIEMRKLSSGSSPMLDLTQLNYPEWPHTCMFSYSNYDSLYMDTNDRWGLEKNFMTSDVSFDGFYFNSYFLNVPIQDTSASPKTDSNSYTYLAVRGYLPTESFQTMLRFYLPNRYDFGFITIKDLIKEVPLTQTAPDKFNPDYSDTVKQFNSNFVFSNLVFGANTTQNLPGAIINSTSFGDFMSQYARTYSNFSTSAVKLQSIQSTLAFEINNFIATNLTYILPASAITRSRFTDPILFEILWKDNLTPNYSVLDDSWGLGWNLGYAKSNTPMSTYQTAQSFYKIQDDYIYLKLNEEFNINGLDTGSKENYTASREPTGSTRQYYCKLLLTSFGGNATTFIHNPITFNPPLNRITNLHFQWLDSTGVIINNNDCDWSMTVSITEQYDMPILPKSMPFLAMSETGPSSGKPADSPFEAKEAAALVKPAA
jgi:hypothetical protein